MMDQRVDQRAGPVAGAGMHDQPGWLVDDDQLGVLVEDVERDVLALRFGWLRLGQATATVSPALSLRPGSATGLPLTATAPWRISAWTRLREKSAPSFWVSHWSSRAPAASGPASNAPIRPIRPLLIRERLRYQGRASGIRILITMARPAFDDEDEKPLDPAVEKVRRKLVRFVAINLGLLFIALMAVVACTCLQVAHRGAAPAAETAVEVPSPEGVVEGQIPLPAGREDRVAVAVGQPHLAVARTCRRQPRHLSLRHRRAAHGRPVRGDGRMSRPRSAHRDRRAGRRRL